MYEKITELREYISDLEIDDRQKNHISDILDSMEAEIEIQEGVYDYLSDEDNYE